MPLTPFRLFHFHLHTHTHTQATDGLAECIVILIIVFANAWLGVYQEARAGEALAALEDLSSPLATVIRNGRAPAEIDSKLLVPGDLVLLNNGMKCSADVRLTETADMACTEAALTGESEPAQKNAAGTHEHEGVEHLTDANMAYMGCVVVDGYGRGLVVHTGMKTRMGEIAHLLNQADKEDSPLEQKLERLGVRLGIASLSCSVLIFIIGITTGNGVNTADPRPVWLQLLINTVALTVAAVPEGLPSCVTICLSVGMGRMVQKNALIRNLHSVETLGSASVICSDKTGTLTTGVMTAVRLWYSGTTYRITSDSQFEGQVAPLSVDTNDRPGMAAAHANFLQSPAVAVLNTAMLSSNARVVFSEKINGLEVQGNSSERPIITAGYKCGIKTDDLEAHFARAHENAFNSTRKTMSVVIASKAGGAEARKPQYLPTSPFLICAKGAPNVVLDNCTHALRADGSVSPLTATDRSAVMAQVDDFSSQAFRVLAIAYRACNEMPANKTAEGIENDLVLVGLVANIDPARSEVKASIRKASNAGVRVVMITGDYVKTAEAIARDIGLLALDAPSDMAVDCQEVRSMGEELAQLEERLKTLKKHKAEKEQCKEQILAVQQKLDRLTDYACVFARAKPSDKLIIVQSLQRQEHVVSMTGDGVNDAPALKQANIGVAMGKCGTDVAKAAADMVLTDDNFVSIVEAIEEGRTIYANIYKFCYFLLTTNVSEVLLTLITTLMNLQIPLSAIQLLWLNLTTDGAPAIALAIEDSEEGIMMQGPRSLKESITDKVMIVGMIVHSIALTGFCMLVYFVGLKWHTDKWLGSNLKVDEHGRQVASTMVAIYIVFAELGRAYSCRSQRLSIFTQGFFTNRWMHWACLTAIGATFGVIYIPGLPFEFVPMTGRDWGLVMGLMPGPFFVDELLKLGFRITKFGERPKIFQRLDLVEVRVGDHKTSAKVVPE
jgi:Ca2+-transporting ATPase